MAELPHGRALAVDLDVTRFVVHLAGHDPERGPLEFGQGVHGEDEPEGRVPSVLR